MSGSGPSLTRVARRMVEALQKETSLARLGALNELASAASDKEAAMRAFAEACAARGDTISASAGEREELRRVLAAANENALILEAVTSTLGDLAAKVRTAATTALDPGTYSLNGRGRRHVRAARVDASV
jgi:hypothetical protein